MSQQFGLHERSLIENLHRKLVRANQRQGFIRWQWFTKQMRELAEKKRLEAIVENARKALQESIPGQRTLEQVARLKEWAYEMQSKTFRSTDSGAVDDVLMNMEFISYSDADLIFLQGDFGTHYYIIFSGKVAIFAGAPVSSLVELKADRKQAAANNDLKGDYLGVRVATVPTGAGFGEVALFEDGIRRTASAVADGFVEMIAVPKQLYHRSFAQYHVEAMEQAEKTSFLSKNKYFKGWPHHRLITMARLLSKRKYSIGDPLLEEGDKTPNIIFIKSGEVKIVKRVLPPNGRDKDFPGPDLSVLKRVKEELGRPRRRQSVINRLTTVVNGRLPQWSSTSRDYRGATTEVAIIATGEVVGGEALAQVGLPLRHGVLASSNIVEAFVLLYSDIKSFQVAAKGTNTLQLIISSSKLRLGREKQREKETSEVILRCHELFKVSPRQDAHDANGGRAGRRNLSHKAKGDHPRSPARGIIPHKAFNVAEDQLWKHEPRSESLERSGPIKVTPVTPIDHQPNHNSDPSLLLDRPLSRFGRGLSVTTGANGSEVATHNGSPDKPGTRPPSSPIHVPQTVLMDQRDNPFFFNDLPSGTVQPSLSPRHSPSASPIGQRQMKQMGQQQGLSALSAQASILRANSHLPLANEPLGDASPDDPRSSKPQPAGNSPLRREKQHGIQKFDEEELARQRQGNLQELGRNDSEGQGHNSFRMQEGRGKLTVSDLKIPSRKNPLKGGRLAQPTHGGKLTSSVFPHRLLPVPASAVLPPAGLNNMKR